GERQDGVVEEISHLAVVEALGHGHIARRPAAAILDSPGARPEILLVDRDDEDARLAGEGRFHAIGMMRVDVDVENAGEPLVEKAENRQRRVVEEAEAAGAVALPVMRAAGG